MKRYVILSGDKTTAGGTVQATTTTLQLNSVHVAHENDVVACRPAIRPAKSNAAVGHVCR